MGFVQLMKHIFCFMNRNGVVILLPLIGLNHMSHNWLGWWIAGRGIRVLFLASWEHITFCEKVYLRVFFFFYFVFSLIFVNWFSRMNPECLVYSQSFIIMLLRNCPWCKVS